MTDNPSHKARRRLLDAALELAPFEGWTGEMLRIAAKQAGLPEGADALYFPGGPLEVIRFWNLELNTACWDRLQALDLDTMRIRDKVTAGVLARFEAMEGHEEAARRALARLALPDGLSLGPQLLWGAADTIWRAIGDVSTDINYYTKRATLSGVLSSTLAAWLADETPKKTKARAFLDARIENVMQFEGAKWKLKNRLKDLPDPLEIMGALRFGPASRRRRRG
ncbi:MAG TPA: COQ9 family protein [Hellea balneolensis]|uniref:COQ9 family protein n=1 Tax=Hellea balneolensis TaxID=287478 RepID=A0A7V5U0Y5_9PROT|nr:COQ9 family protein [Hellea balneolensis]